MHSIRKIIKEKKLLVTLNKLFIKINEFTKNPFLTVYNYDIHLPMVAEAG